jgi:hypothetical protein
MPDGGNPEKSILLVVDGHEPLLRLPQSWRPKTLLFIPFAFQRLGRIANNPPFSAQAIPTKKSGKNYSDFCLTVFEHIPNMLTAGSGSGAARAGEFQRREAAATYMQVAA